MAQRANCTSWSKCKPSRLCLWWKQTTSTVGKQTGDSIRDHPKSSLSFVQSHVTRTVLHFQCNQTQPDYDTQQNCSFIAIIAMLLRFYKSFFVVYKLLYQTINGNKWGNKDVLPLFSLLVTTVGVVQCHAVHVRTSRGRWSFHNLNTEGSTCQSGRVRKKGCDLLCYCPNSCQRFSSQTQKKNFLLFVIAQFSSRSLHQCKLTILTI